MNTERQSFQESVSDMIAHHGLGTLRKYWDLCNQAKPMRDVEAFYCFSAEEPRYGNIAAIVDGQVIDIEGDESDGTGIVVFRDLSSIASVQLRTPPIGGYSRSEDATLAIITRLRGESNTGPYWVAITPQDYENLIQFASTLIRHVRS